MDEIRLLFGTTIPGQPLLSSDLLWKTQFKTPDPFFFCELSNGRNIMLVNALEYERAKKEAKNCLIELIDKFMNKINSPYLIDGLIEFLRTNPLDKVVVHSDTPCFVVKKLQESGIQVEIHDRKKLWYPERASKNAQEVQYITEVQRKLERVTLAAIQILREATVSSHGNLIAKNGTIVTSEYIREFMDVEFMREGCLVIDTIVACGDQGADPHCVGTGPLQANLPIIFDVFPRSKENFYWADMTRTVFKGKPTEEARKMYQAVLDAQCLAINMIHAGVDGSTIQSAVTEFFEKNGYRTGEKDGKIQGFMHGVGHSLGIDIHESPGIRIVSQTLPEGCVVTVEPGLYYFDIGGVRIEDLVVVEKDGVRNLTTFPKEFEEMIL